MTHLNRYAECISSLLTEPAPCQSRLRMYAKMISSAVKTGKKPDRPEIVLDGEIIIAIKS